MEVKKCFAALCWEFCPKAEDNNTLDSFSKDFDCCRTIPARVVHRENPNSGSSKSSSPLMSPPELVSSLDNGSGFQRGFLLNNPSTTRAKGSKGRVRPQKTIKPVPSKSSGGTTTNDGEKSSVSCLVPDLPLLIAEPAAPAVESKERNNVIKKDQPNPPVARASEKKDSGWTKGFLTTKQKRNPTATDMGKKLKEDSTARRSKPHSPITQRYNGKDPGWSKGFLTNKSITKKEKKIKDGMKRTLPDNGRDSKTGRSQKDPPSRNDPKTIRSSRSSDILLSIDDDDTCRNNAARKPSPANNARNREPLIRVIFDDNANECLSSSHILQQEESAIVCSKGGIDCNVEGTTTTKLSSKSLITPLMYMREDNDCVEGNPTSVLIKEVSTTRKLNHEGADRAELLDYREEEHCYYLRASNGSTTATDVMKHESSHHKSTFVSTIGSTDISSKTDEKEHDVVSSRRNDGDDNNYKHNILGFQQKLERLFSRPMNLSQPKECKGQYDYNDDSQAATLMQFRTLEHRRCCWTYVLQRRQQQPHRHKHGLKRSREKNECDYRIRALFDAEFFFHRQQRNEKINYDCDDSSDIENPLISILRCLETASDRKMALEAVLIIQEYFVFRYKEQEQCKQHQTPQSSGNGIVVNIQAENVQRLIPLFIQLTHLSLDNRRTLFVHTAWETAILLFCFCIRESSGMQRPSFLDLPVTFWENFDVLLHQQLIWQKFKTKPNAEKMVRLKEIRIKSKNVLKDRKNTPQETLNSSLLLLDELAINLVKLIGL